MNLQQHFAHIRAFYRSHTRMPSYSELTAVVGFRSKHAAYKLVQRLVVHEWVEKDATGKLLPGRLFHAVPLVGTVTAGFPSPAEEELADTMTLDEYLITNKEATYMLKVDGESMIEAGILPGDLLLVERGVDPRDGDIVIAQVDREWTIKYFRKRGRAVFLEAANKDFKPIYGTGSVSCNSGLRSAFMPLFASRRAHGARSHGPESLKLLPGLDGS
jgi:repressor LexA